MKLTKRLPFSQAANWPDMVKLALREAYTWKKDVVIQVKADEETRSIKQNNLMWKWHGEYAQHRHDACGEVFTSEQWHEKCVKLFLPSEPVLMRGEWHICRKSTKKLPVREFAEFLTKYEIAAADEDCHFSRPDELYIQALMRD